MKKYTLSKHDVSEILGLMNKWPKADLLSQVKTINITEIEPGSSLLSGEDFMAVRIGDHVLPFLAKEENLKSFPSVSVDMGAVQYVCNGARVMRPGIVAMDEFNDGDIVVVKDSKHGKYLAVGLALKSSAEAQAMAKGPVVDNKHYVGDKFWNAHKEEAQG